MRIVYCAGEEGRVVLDVLRRAGVPEDVVFLDDDEELWGTNVAGTEVVGGAEVLDELDTDTANVVIAYGDRRTVRLRIAERVRDTGLELFSVIDDDSTVSETATVGDGVIVNAQSYVGPDAALADVVLIDSGVVVSHDVRLESGVTVGPNVTLAGGVSIGRDAYIGAGATILDDLTIGKKAVIGAGAVVTSDVEEDTTVIGVPAKPRQ